MNIPILYLRIALLSISLFLFLGLNAQYSNFNDFESGWGIWNDGGSDCYRKHDESKTADNSSYSIRLRDNSGKYSSMTTDNLNLSGYTSVSLELDYYAINLLAGHSLFVEYSSDGGNSFQTIKELKYGIDFQNNVFRNVSFSHSAPFNGSSKFRIRSHTLRNSHQIYVDNVYISTSTGGNVDPCANQNGDSDNDGVCNVDDQCPGGDDNADQDNDGVADYCDCAPNNGSFPATPNSYCDDGNPNTENDRVSSDGCDCAGTLVNSGGGCYYTEMDYNDFESGWGIWYDGGSDSYRINAPQYAKSGGYSIRLRDDSGKSSSMYTKALNLSGTTSVKIDFSYIATGFSYGEVFLLEYSLDNGYSYSQAKEWKRGTHFNLSQRQNVSVEIGGPFNNNTRFRIRSDASSNYDKVYIDNLKMSTCNGGSIDPCANKNGDSDNDGICNDDDQCPGGDDNIDSDGDGVSDFCDCLPFKKAGDSCNDYNSNTENDTVTSDGCGCAGTPIVPICDPEPVCENKVYYKHGGDSGWRLGCNVTASCGDKVVLNGPGKYLGWNWEWTGPGSFVQKTGHDVDIIELHNINDSHAGTYTATWTDTKGCTGQLSFDLILNNSCAPICDPEPVCENKVYYKHGGDSGWRLGCNVTASCGDKVVLNGPGKYLGWNWEWTGPGSFVQKTGHDVDVIELHNINDSHAGTYTATWTDTKGCTGQLSFDLILNNSCAPICDPEPVCENKVYYKHGGDSGWRLGCDVTVNCGDKVLLNAPGLYPGWNWQWSGPGSFTQKTGSSVDMIEFLHVDASDSGTYTANWTDAKGCTGQITFNLTVNGCASGNDCNYQVYDFNDFEHGWGIWKDGGSDCYRIGDHSYASSGSYSIRLRDNSGHYSSMYTHDLHLSHASKIKVEFDYYAVNFAHGEDFFLEYSVDGGHSYSQAHIWTKGTDFNNNESKSASVEISGPFSSNTRFKIRADASSNYDKVFIDNVRILKCEGQNDPCAHKNGDSDNDGVCNDHDCQPFDPLFPGNPGDMCDDNDPNTENDQITADGCGCEGTPLPPPCNLTVDAGQDLLFCPSEGITLTANASDATVCVQCEVTLYLDCHYGGHSITLGPGEYDLNALGFKDKVSSLQTSGCCEVTLFDHVDFSGASVSKPHGDDCLVNNGFNDRASSIRITACSPDNADQASTISDVTYAWSTGANTRQINVNQSGTYTVTVTDCQGCEAIDEVTLTDPPACAVICPVSSALLPIDLGCNPTELPTAESIAPLINVSGSCMTPEITAGAVIGECYDITQVFTVIGRDECGDVASECKLYFTWKVDTEEPIIECPSSDAVGGIIDLGCNPTKGTDGVPIDIPFTVVAIDNCSNSAILVNGSFDEIANNGCEVIFQRYWEYTDECGNSSQCVSTYTWIEDETGPTFANCTDNNDNNNTQDLGCNPTTLPTASDAIALAGAITESCDLGGSVPTASLISLADNGCQFTQVWTVSITDGCNNTGTCEVSFTWIEDDTAPTFANCIDGDDDNNFQNLGCNPELPSSAAAISLAGDVIENCPLGIGEVIATPGDIERDGCEASQEWVVMVTDGCNNTGTCEVSFTWIEDVTAPTFAYCTNNNGSNDAQDLGCNPTTLPTASDAIALAGVIAESCDLGGNVPTASGAAPSRDGCIVSQVWTVSITDDCNNTGTCDVSFTWIEDVTAPAFANCTDGDDSNNTVDLGCNPTSAELPTPQDAIALAGAINETCDLGTNQAMASASTIIQNGCIFSQDWTVSIMDVCGNTGTCNVTFIWTVDMTVPVLQCPSDNGNNTIDLGCNPPKVNGVPTGIPDIINVEDNCTSASTTSSFTDAMSDNGCERSLTRTWTATDDCGNQGTCSTTWIWTEVNNSDINLMCPSADLTLSCGYSSTEVSSWIGEAVATGCSGELSVDNDLGDRLVNLDRCAGGTVLVTFTATDICNTSTTCFANIILEPCIEPISGIAFSDIDGDGCYEPGAGESIIGGLTVTLTDCAGNVISDASGNSTSVTDMNTGEYTFNLCGISDYKVVFDIPTGASTTTKDISTSGCINSNINPDGSSDCTTPDNPDGPDGGFLMSTGLGDFVYEDLNANGIQDDGESGLANVMVILSNADGSSVSDIMGNPVGPFTTTSTGLYSFPNLTPGNYIVTFMAPSGAIITTKNVGGATNPDESNADSDADPNTGKTDVISLLSGQNINTVDAGLYFPASIGGIAFLDTNGDGLQEVSQSGVAAVMVTLTSGDGMPVNDVNGQLVGDITTGADGTYQFADLLPGDYKLTYSIPTDQVFSPENVSGLPDDESINDSDADPSTNMTDVVTLSSGEEENDIDVGVVPCIKITGTAFIDGDGSGCFEGDPDTPLSTKVRLFKCDLNDNISGSPLDSIITSSATGEYMFELCGVEGPFAVEFDVPDQFVVTDKNASGCSGIDSEINSDGISDCLDGSTPIDGGFVPCQSLGITIANTEICAGTMIDPFGLPNFPAGGVITPSPISGMIGVGTYTVEYVDAAGCNGSTSFAVTEKTETLTGVAFFDNDNDGCLDPNPLYAAVKVRLFKCDMAGMVIGNALDSVITSASDGAYTFDICDIDGPFVVEFDIPDNHLATQKGASCTSVNSEINMDGRSDCIDGSTPIDGGFAPCRTISGITFKDIDQDGCKDSDDPIITNVPVSLVQCDGVTPLNVNGNTYSTTTDANGAYSFEICGLTSNFIVKFGLPSSELFPTKFNEPGCETNNSDMTIDFLSFCVDGSAPIDAGFLEICSESVASCDARDNSLFFKETITISLGTIVLGTFDNYAMYDYTFNQAECRCDSVEIICIDCKNAPFEIVQRDENGNCQVDNFVDIYLDENGNQVQCSSNPDCPVNAECVNPIFVNFIYEELPMTKSRNIETSESIEIFPNPAFDEINVRFSSDVENEFQLTIHDIRGQIVGEYQISKKLRSLRLEELRSGLYYLRFTNSKKTIIKELVITQ